MNRDQKFFDMYSLILGVLGALAIAILVLSMKLSDLTEGVYQRDTSEYQAEIDKRIAPVGGVYMPGDPALTAAPVVAKAKEPVATVLTGPQVYNSTCTACHGTGIGNAPIFGDAASWAPHIAKGIDTLKQHALQGFTGEDGGVMPAKGGRVDLSDGEITAAVDYMVSKSK